MTAALLDPPAWVLDQLTAAGLDHPTPLTHRRRTTTARRCLHCRQPVWVGPCWPHTAVHLDPAPLTTLGEMVAILTGRRTYEISYGGEIQRRTPAHIEYATADQTRVYAAHECGAVLPVNEKWAPPPNTESDTPPF